MIVIPMAGLSSRFFKAGYKSPKYMLKAHGESLFDHSVKSFSAYFKSERFIFIVRDVYETPAYVQQRAIELGIVSFDIVVLNEETRGQAETVALGLADYRKSNESITIFNIDTFRPGFKYPALDELGDGYLEVFQGGGDNWSFVRPVDDGGTQVNLTTEKNPVSDLCCTGLYFFKNIQDFFETYEYYLTLPKDLWEKGELYVAPLYNYLIANNRSIHYHLVPRKEVIFCGTPEEYLSFQEKG